MSIEDAVKTDDLQMLKELLEQGESFSNDKDLLDTAIANGNTEMIKLLIEYGADLSYLGLEAINQAVINEDEELLRLILDNGFQVRSVRETEEKREDEDEDDQLEYNYNPLNRAAYNGNLDMVRLLLSYSFDATDELFVEMLLGEDTDLEVAQLLLESGVDYKLPDSELLSLLNNISYPSSLKAISLLVDKGYVDISMLSQDIQFIAVVASNDCFDFLQKLLQSRNFTLDELEFILENSDHNQYVAKLIEEIEKEIRELGLNNDLTKIMSKY